MTNAEPIFYVIEAQWTLPKTDVNQQDTVSKWGFVKEEVSHVKAIIRNIQRDSRWYTFRVGCSYTTWIFIIFNSYKTFSFKFKFK